MKQLHHQKDIPNDVLSIEDTSRYTGLSKPSLRKMAKMGTLPRRQFNGLGRPRYFYLKKEVDKALSRLHEN